MLRVLLRAVLALLLVQGSNSFAQLQLLTPYAGSTCTTNTFANAINASGVLTCATPSVSSVVLSSIAAANAVNTIANGNNTGQVWNWANTTDSTVAFTFGETSAATGGTSTSGVPNQVLLKVTTLASSTQSPLSVYSRGSHVFSVSPTSQQIIANPAIATYSFANNTTTGMGLNGSILNFRVSNVNAMQLSSSQVTIPVGSASFPTLTDLSNSVTGLSWVGFDLVVNNSSDGEWVRFMSPPALRISRGSADATAYALNFRKARNTVALPNVITTGDALSTISGYGYVGSTNTYREAARIEYDSTGTISDATTGIGGIVKIMSTLSSTDSAVQENVRFAGGSQPYSQWAPTTFANLPAPPVNGMLTYCSDCTIANPCASGGTGAFAKRLNGAWICN